MNLRGFKKTHEDDEKAILQNQRGHEITLAKKQLSKGHLESLKKLPLYKAGGGETPEPGGDDTGPVPLQAPEPTPEEPVAEEQTAPAAPATQATPLPAPNIGPVANGEEYANSLKPEEYAASHAQQMNQEDALYAQDLKNGHIKPQTYKDMLHSTGTMGKVGTLFGLLLSGAGSGLAHQPNMVLEMMNKEIDRDLDAQKNSKENALKYYQLNLQHQLNKAGIKKTGAETIGLMRDAELKADAHAKNQMQLGILHELQGNVDSLPQGENKMRAQQVLDGVKGAAVQNIGQRNQVTAKNMSLDPEASFAKKQTLLRMSGVEGGESIARMNEEKHLPGFGDASVPVPSDTRQDLLAKLEYDKAARKYIDFAKQHQGNWANLNPKQRMEVAKKGAVLGAELQGKYRLKTKGGVYKEGEQKFIESIIPTNAASWQASFNQIPKVEQTINNNSSDMNNLAGGYGLTAPKFYKGKYYTKGKNGEAVEVKQ